MLPRPIWPSFLGSEALCSLVCFRCLTDKSASCLRAKRASFMWLLLSSGMRLSLGSFVRTSCGTRSSSSSGSVPELPAARRHGLNSGLLRTRSLFGEATATSSPPCVRLPSVAHTRLRQGLCEPVCKSPLSYKLALRCLRAYLRFVFQSVGVSESKRATPALYVYAKARGPCVGAL